MSIRITSLHTGKPCQTYVPEEMDSAEVVKHLCALLCPFWNKHGEWPHSMPGVCAVQPSMAIPAKLVCSCIDDTTYAHQESEAYCESLRE